jgi:hypothetical protein
LKRKENEDEQAMIYNQSDIYHQKYQTGIKSRGSSNSPVDQIRASGPS